MVIGQAGLGALLTDLGGRGERRQLMGAFGDPDTSQRSGEEISEPMLSAHCAFQRHPNPFPC